MKYNNDIQLETEYIPVITRRKKRENWFTRLFSTPTVVNTNEPDFETGYIPEVTNRVKKDNWFTRLFGPKDVKPAIEPRNNVIKPEIMNAIEINNKKIDYINRYIKLYDFDQNKEITNFMDLINVRVDKVRITDELFDYVKENIKNDNEQEFLDKLYEIFKMKKADNTQKTDAFSRIQNITSEEEEEEISDIFDHSIYDKWEKRKLERQLNNSKTGAFSRIQNITQEDEEKAEVEEPIEKTVVEEPIKVEPAIKYVEKVTIPQIEETKPLRIEKQEDSSIISSEEKNFIFENYNHKDFDKDLEKYETKLNKLKCKLLDKKFELSVADDNDKSLLKGKIADIEGQISKVERKIKACKLKTYYFEQECIRVAEQEQNERLEEIRLAEEKEQQRKLQEFKMQKEQEDKKYIEFWNNADAKDLSVLQNYTDEEIKELYERSKEDSLMGKAAKEMIKKINADLEKKEAARLKVTVKVLRELKELNKQGLTKKGLKQVIATYKLSADAELAMLKRYNATNHKEYMKSMMQ